MSNAGSIISYYNNVHHLKTYYNWSIQEIDALLPWEYNIYIQLLNRDIQKRKENLQKQSHH
mgnify:FL=1|nr:MAG TPA: hypothetical protein [Caudoviricetes sp.]